MSNKTILGAKRLTENENDKILELNKAGTSIRKTAKILNTSLTTVRRVLAKFSKDPDNGVLDRQKYASVKGFSSKIKFECPTCQGSKKDCKACFDDGIGQSTGLSMFYYQATVNDEPLTKFNRTKSLFDFAKYLGLTNVEGLADWWKRPGKTSEENYIYFEKRIGSGYITQELNQKRQLQRRSQQTMISHLQIAYKMNRETGIPWDRIKPYIKPPKNKVRLEEDSYSESQIKMIYLNSELKYRALIAVLMSGMRIGAIYENNFSDHYLKIGDLTDPMTEEFDREQADTLIRMIPKYDGNPIYQMKLYADDINPRTGIPDQYVCWTTPEGRDLIDQMLRKRQRDGELGETFRDLEKKPYNIRNFPDDTPVFRTRYNSEPDRHKLSEDEKKEKERIRIYDLTHPVPLEQGDMVDYLYARRKKYLDSPTKRVKVTNGFRSYVYSVMLHNAKISEREIYWLQGRDLGGTSKAYDRWGKLDRIKTFWSALEWLTIDKEKYYLDRIAEKTQEVKDLELDERHRKEFEWGVHDISNRALQGNIQNQQAIENLAAAFMLLMTPEQREMAKQLPQLKNVLQSVSSLPLEDKKKIILGPRDDGEAEQGSNDGESNGATT